jgi:hypothetical protein
MLAPSYQIKLCHLPEPSEVDFGIDTCCVCTAMAEMIANLLQAQTRGDEVTSATMPKTMGTTAWYPNLQCLDTAADNVVHGARRERPKRSFERHEQLSMGTSPASVPEILKYRVTDREH